MASAAESVPFYRETVVTDASELRELKELEQIIEKFQILKKDDLRNCAPSMVSDRFKGKLITVSTSGSTGSPLEIRMDRDSREINYAFFHKFLESIGVNEFERSATFAGRILVPPHQQRAPYWRVNKAMNTLLLSSYHLSKKSCLDYIGAIEDWAPFFIDSYPSAIYELALLLKDEGYRPNLKLKAIVTSSETLFYYQRELIEDVFSCPVYDYYGCAEQSVLAFQTPLSQGDYIVPSQYCLVEVLDEKSSPVAPGESGRIICTNIFNSATPVIRYEIGDNAIVGDYYPGTRFASRLASIEGRVDDVVVTPEGHKVGRLDPVFKGLGGIKETQIVQVSRSMLTLNVVTIEGKPINEKKLVSMLRERVGTEIEIDIRYMDRIPRSSSGKFRSVISNI
ncbi:phenylacetate--CoA ligase family protein [Marinobacter fonticola]|uniref:phenylacetate--CoA ligase family protein n=1 Tax=Marinobacter fonticola TaxID=2603215 RepID=UPI0011E801E5|nr:phenylacetate--CoA ligase family protein [Marinobacter fonticola]